MSRVKFFEFGNFAFSNEIEDSVRIKKLPGTEFEPSEMFKLSISNKPRSFVLFLLC